MGFSFVGRKLACDACPAYGSEAGVRKRHCPTRHCPAVALCKACWKGVPGQTSRAYHVTNDRKGKSAKFRAEEIARREALEAGAFLLSVAWGRVSPDQPPGTVVVCFRGKASEVWYLIPDEEYDRCRRGMIVVTPECFPSARPTDLRMRYGAAHG